MDESTFHALLQKGDQHRASDVLFKVGQPPAFRIGGELHYLQGDKLRPDHTLRLAEHVLGASRVRGQIDELQQFDTAYGVPGIGRYRVNVYRQRGTLAIAMRSIPLRIPTFEELGSPPVARALAVRLYAPNTSDSISAGSTYCISSTATAISCFLQPT